MYVVALFGLECKAERGKERRRCDLSGRSEADFGEGRHGDDVDVDGELAWRLLEQEAAQTQRAKSGPHRGTACFGSLTPGVMFQECKTGGV